MYPPKFREFLLWATGSAETEPTKFLERCNLKDEMRSLKPTIWTVQRHIHIQYGSGNRIIFKSEIDIDTSLNILVTSSSTSARIYRCQPYKTEPCLFINSNGGRSFSLFMFHVCFRTCGRLYMQKKKRQNKSLRNYRTDLDLCCILIHNTTLELFVFLVNK